MVTFVTFFFIPFRTSMKYIDIFRYELLGDKNLLPWNLSIALNFGNFFIQQQFILNIYFQIFYFILALQLNIFAIKA